jgi:protein SCO1/2
VGNDLSSQDPHRRRGLPPAALAALGLILGVLALLAGWYLGERLSGHSEPRQPQLGGDFTLRSAQGPVSLSGFRGKVVPIYFGYSSCPDVCPTNLALIGGALRALDADELAQVQPIFITVDPERDTPERAAEYAAYFHPKMLGLSGSPEEIAAVARAYGVAYMKVEEPDSAMGYSVDHSSRTYLMGKDGKLFTLIPHAAPSEDIVAAIRKALAE